ncbi:MAG: nucleotidyl transferase AbiEii/AbiGii toxin family protein [Leptospiraceae bacterium]|nr:nucleotidyl transferase AbiEii/AbiGii toxin family protein [Leptospiraceae bacterium]
MDLYEIKKLAIISLASDDDLFDALVMKGGTALDTIYKVTGRQSIDIDYSMQDDPFQNYEIASLKEKIEKLFISEFSKNNYHVFDFHFEKRPSQPSENRPANWYGYRIDFKVIPDSEKSNDLEKDRKKALSLGKKEKKNFEIDISPFEFTKYKIKTSFEDYNIYVYDPRMILIEKLRSICQQMNEYKSIYQLGKVKGRAKDFYDISLLIDKNLVALNDENKESFRIMIHGIFGAKEVDIKLLDLIPQYRNLHESDFLSVQATVPSTETIQNFDYYFEKVNLFILRLKEFGIV